VKPYLNHFKLGSKRLSWTIACLLIIADLQVDKTRLQCLWAGLHPRATQSQQTNPLNFQALEYSTRSKRCPPTRVDKAPLAQGIHPSRACQDCAQDTLQATRFLIIVITGNRRLEPLLEDLLSQIHMDLSSWFSAGIQPGTCG